MSNDDFLKKHQKRTRPRPEFVESLHESINTQRSPLMITRRMHPAFLTLIAIMAIALLALTISPTARATARSFMTAMTINGVEVSQNEQTGELTVSGNTDAVVSNDGETVVIETGDDGSVAVVNSDTMSPEMLSVDDVEIEYPGFVMPTNVPEEYGIIPMAFTAGTNGVGIGWQNSDGHQITYTWNVDRMEVSSEEEAEMVEKGVELIDGFRHAYMVIGGDTVILSGAKDGIGYLIVATDISLTEDELSAILP